MFILVVLYGRQMSVKQVLKCDNSEHKHLGCSTVLTKHMSIGHILSWTKQPYIVLNVFFVVPGSNSRWEMFLIY